MLQYMVPANIDEVLHSYKLGWRISFFSWRILVRTLKALLTASKEYIRYCEDKLVPSKKFCFPNNTPWIHKDIKGFLNRKKMVFMAKDREEF